MLLKTPAYAAHSPALPLGLYQIERREPGATDVLIDITFCGICHSDLHMARNEWRGTTYPIVPGHEIVGRVAQVGAAVKAFKLGETVGVGCMVDSCRTCPSCRSGFEQYCENEVVFTYNSPDNHSGGLTYGGYSSRIVVDEKFVLRISDRLDPAAAAPLLCAGITTYSPLRHWKVDKGQRVGIVGLGGLGHMGVKLANALGTHVTLFTTSPRKAEDARRLGAHEVVISTNAKDMSRHAGTIDFMINTVAAPHDLDPYISLLSRDGTMCLVGVPPERHPPADLAKLIFKRRRISGSMIGGIRETQEMLDFCAERSITCDVEVIPIQQVNEAYERMLKGNVKYRFVIDIASLK